ncbi:MAG: hypothetical protein J0H11_13645 [Rhizobiales bacterium]|nr:hypothetical protein [Hyphomicrobiales bacterium]
MKTLAYTQEVEGELQDIHRGLHIAMDRLIAQRDYDEAETVLRQVDQRMSTLINKSKVVSVK